METDVAAGGLDGRYYAVGASALRRARRRQLLTQQQLEATSGVHRATISQIELGARKQVRSDTLRALSEALRVEAEVLLVDWGSGEEDEDER